MLLILGRKVRATESIATVRNLNVSNSIVIALPMESSALIVTALLFNYHLLDLGNCKDCHNNLQNENERSRAIKNSLERNPNAFRPKIGELF